MLDNVLPILSAANCVVDVETQRKKSDCVRGKHSFYPPAKINLCVCVCATAVAHGSITPVYDSE